MTVSIRNAGNEFFKQQKYPEAVKHYTEAIRRNPKDHRAYSNRDVCYIKLGAMPEGLKDAEKCIELDPTFSKGFTRKGAVQFFMEEYDKALETYREGLKHDPNNLELLDGIRRCVEQINKASRGDLSPEELKERQINIQLDETKISKLTILKKLEEAAEEVLHSQQVLTDALSRILKLQTESNMLLKRLCRNGCRRMI